MAKEKPSAAGKLQILLVEACVAYRQARSATDKRSSERLYMLRGKIKALAEAVCWTTDAEKRPTQSQIRATEKDFMKRSKDAPEF